tara:strand:+ start:220 stop:405 length:186 start_codon:yes stop_codon:yes gene_type:complete
MGYLGDSKGTKGQTYYSGSNPKKSIANKIGFSSAKKKNKQSDGFFDMTVKYLKRAVKEMID